MVSVNKEETGCCHFFPHMNYTNISIYGLCVVILAYRESDTYRIITSVLRNILYHSLPYGRIPGNMYMWIKNRSSYNFLFGPLMRRASFTSCGMMVTLLAWMAQRLTSMNKPTINASVASCFKRMSAWNTKTIRKNMYPSRSRFSNFQISFIFIFCLCMCFKP